MEEGDKEIVSGNFHHWSCGKLWCSDYLCNDWQGYDKYDESGPNYCKWNKDGEEDFETTSLVLCDVLHYNFRNDIVNVFDNHQTNVIYLNYDIKHSPWIY